MDRNPFGCNPSKAEVAEGYRKGPQRWSLCALCANLRVLCVARPGLVLELPRARPIKDWRTLWFLDPEHSVWQPCPSRRVTRGLQTGWWDAS